MNQVKEDKGLIKITEKRWGQEEDRSGSGSNGNKGSGEESEDQEWIADMRSAIHRGSNGRDREEWGKAEAEGEDALSEKLGRKNARPEDEDKV